jgi:hypothetical protein
MDLQKLKLSRLMFYVENSSKSKLEELYFTCFSENPLDELTTEDLQYNITYYLTSSPSDEVNRIFKETLV